jgi:hypothetical protein
MLLKCRNTIRLNKRRCTSFALLVLITSFPVYASTIPAIQLFKKSPKVSNDTSIVNRHIEKALEYAYHSKKIEYVKAHIDSAEAVCVEKNIEFPTLLHLARAEYFTGRYSGNEQSQSK